MKHVDTNSIKHFGVCFILCLLGLYGVSAAIGASGDNYRSLKGDFTRGSSGLNTGTVNFFVFYPF